MKALWWSCVLGLLMSADRGKANTVTATQMPSSTSEIWLNSSVTISCSITGILANGLTLIRRFPIQEILFLHLKKGQIGKNITEPIYEGRIKFKKEPQKDTGLNITVILSRMQVDDTDLYYCKWNYMDGDLKTSLSNGSIIIVKAAKYQKTAQCNDDILDILSVALSVVSIPFVLCLLILSAFALCKRFTKTFTPSRSAVRPLPRRPPPRRPLPPCPPPQCQTYTYLSTSASSAFSQEYMH